MYNIKKLRAQKGWTQEQLSEKSGVHRVLIANYQSKGAGMTIVTAAKLADALGCTVYDLIKEESA
jgi:putative transcriptional regulator